LKILYITYDGLLDPIGQSQIVPYLNKLADMHEIYVLSLEKKNINKIIINSKIVWIKKKFYKTKIKFFKIIDILKLLIYARNILKHNLIESIHCRGHIPAFVAYVLIFFYKKKIIFDFRGFWIEERFDNQLWSKRNIVHIFAFYLFKLLEKKILLKSSKVVVLTSTAKSFLIKKFGIPKKNLFVIPCCADFNFFKKISKKKKKKYLNICYVGSYGNIYMFKEMYKFYVNLKKNLNINFHLFVNNLSEFKKDKIYNKFKYDNNVFITKSSRKQLIKYLSIMDYSVCFIRPTFARITASFPTKLAEVLACGIPVLYNNCMSDVNYYMRKNKLNQMVNLNKFKKLNLRNINILDKKIIQNQYSNYLDIKRGVNSYNLVYEKK
jgi:glycosyltransferase involved in cell wall biosynthesis